MAHDIDFEGAERLVVRVFGRAASQTKLWIGGWLTAILVVRALAVVFHASIGAYVTLLAVTGVAVFAGDGHGSGSSTETGCSVSGHES